MRGKLLEPEPASSTLFAHPLFLAAFEPTADSERAKARLSPRASARQNSRFVLRPAADHVRVGEAPLCSLSEVGVPARFAGFPGHLSRFPPSPALMRVSIPPIVPPLALRCPLPPLGLRGPLARNRPRLGMTVLLPDFAVSHVAEGALCEILADMRETELMAGCALLRRSWLRRIFCRAARAFSLFATSLNTTVAVPVHHGAISESKRAAGSAGSIGCQLCCRPSLAHPALQMVIPVRPRVASQATLVRVRLCSVRRRAD
jgi:hypothetical protein